MRCASFNSNGMRHMSLVLMLQRVDGHHQLNTNRHGALVVRHAGATSHAFHAALKKRQPKRGSSVGAVLAS